MIAAAAVGVTVGLAGHIFMPTRRNVTRLLPVAVGAAAAVAGTIAVWLTDHRTDTLTPTGLARQTLFAGIAVAVVAAKVNPRRQTGGAERG